MKKFFLGFLFLFVSTSTMFAATYYVSPTGNDITGDGSSGSPWATIQHAADTVNAGDTVIVNDGTYSHPDAGATNGIVVYITRSGSSGSPITFRAAHKWAAKIDGLNYSTKTGFHVSANYIIVQDFDIYNVGGNCSYQNNNCHQGGAGIVINGSNNQIIGNDIHDSGRYCTQEPYGLDAVEVKNFSNTLIDSNRVHDNGRLSEGENGCNNGGNEFYKNVDHGVYILGSTNTSVVNNLLYRNLHGWSVHIYNSDQLVSYNLVIANNTFAVPNPWRTGQITVSASWSTGYIRNNIFYQPTTAAIRQTTGTLGTVYVDHNLTTSGNIWYNEGGGSGSPNTSNGGNMTGVSITGLLVDPANNDYRLPAGSLAIDAGVMISGVTDDYEGASRPNGAAYDIGAYEYVGVPLLPSVPTNLRVVRGSE